MRRLWFRRRLPTSSKVFFGLAGTCALLAFTLVRGQAARGASDRALAGPMVPVIVAARDLDAGATVGVQDVRVQEFPRALVPPGSLGSVVDAVGKVAEVAFWKGEPIVEGRLSVSMLSGTVPQGHVVVTAGFASVPDGLSTADRVDAYATFGGARPYTSLVGEDLRVLRIASSTDALGVDAATLVTLDVDPVTARQMVEADATGSLALVVRGTGPFTASPSLAALSPSPPG